MSRHRIFPIFLRDFTEAATLGGPVINASIGLTIVSRIIDMHGEVVDVTNTVERGALFRFSLSCMDRGDTPRIREQFPA